MAQNNDGPRKDFEALLLPLAFYFRVSIDDDDTETSFQEVSGLDVEREIEEIAGGGQNNFKHRLPGRTKYTNLVLKRGMGKKGSKLIEWVKEVTSGDLAKAIEPKKLTVQLLYPYSASGGDPTQPLVTWNIQRAYPIKWSISNFNSTENAYVIETVEFAFQSFAVDYP